MLTSISLDNFKSYQSAILPLATLTFLIGANASGKSNALEAIRLLHWLARGTRLDDIGQETGGMKAAFRGYAEDLFLNPTAPLTLGVGFSTENGPCEFSISIGLKQAGLQIVGEEITIGPAKTPYYQIGQPSGNEETWGTNFFFPDANHIIMASLVDHPVFYQLPPHPSGPDWASELRQHLRRVLMLDAYPPAMRGYANIRDGELEENGSNLSAVLFNICQQGAAAKQTLLDFIRSLPEQDITDFQFIETGRRDVMVRLQESFGGQQRLIDAPLLSDGTLRVLAIGAALLSAPPGSLLVIEEIDNGVHPSRVANLVQQMQELATQRQLRLLFTSHNPALLDALPDAALAAVLCCYRDPKDGASRMVRLGDMERYPELMAQGPLGDLMTRRVLERFLKDDTSPEQRKTAALDWLQQFNDSAGKGR
jgi:predicted ATPase